VLKAKKDETKKIENHYDCIVKKKSSVKDESPTNQQTLLVSQLETEPLIIKAESKPCIKMNNISN